MQHLSTKALFQKQFRASEQEIEEAQRQRITMDEFRGIQTALFLMLLLQFTGAATGRRELYLAVRDGDEITLPCNSVIDDQNNCDSTTWFYRHSSSRPVVLVTDGQIDEQAEDKSDRLSVTENCSLVIKKLTEEEDAGQYYCRQIRSGQQLGLDAVVYLSFVTMTEQKNSDEVTLTCSVSTYDECRHTVKWLFKGQDLDKDNGDLKTSQSLCSASVTFRTSHYIHTSSYQSLKCEVTDSFTGTPQLFPFRLSGEDTTTESPTPELPTPESPTSGNSTAGGWVYAVVAGVLAALLIIVVAVIIWKRRKGNTQMDDNVELTSDPALTQSAPESSRDTADPEDGVSYASVSYTKKANSKAKVRSKTDDDAVTYTTVKASSADPSSLYATIN
ncbi:uncharacterized protein LOC141755947 [Sebastes fasciatus]|uniref:uncharacterized protein LOC141755947 n=1 Tax=Sebastes fasciatus TaxID=394691 RepID=UPI003D9F1D24